MPRSPVSATTVEAGGVRRETLSRVAAGAVAAKCLERYGIGVAGRICEIGGETTLEGMEEAIRTARQEGDSVGGIVEVVVSGCPSGLGDPVFGKLDAMIAAALMGIGAVKGVEIGAGFAVARMRGSENNDPITPKDSLAITPAASSAGSAPVSRSWPGSPSSPRPRSKKSRRRSIRLEMSGGYGYMAATTPASRCGSCRSRSACWRS